MAAIRDGSIRRGITAPAGDNSDRYATTAFAAALAAAGFARTAKADVAYTAAPADRLIAYTSLTAPRTVTLPAASAYPVGATLTVADESLACSSTVTLTIAAAGSDKINGAASAVMTVAGSYLALTSDGTSKWTIVDGNVPTAAALVAALVAMAAGLPTSDPLVANQPWLNGGAFFFSKGP